MAGASTTIATDVLIIGGGVGGLAAAIAAREAGGSVLVVSKGPVGGQSASHYAAGMFALHLPDGKPGSVRAWIADSPLTDPAVAEALVGAVVPQIRTLQSYGIPITPSPDGSFKVENSRPGFWAGGAAMIARMADVAQRAGVTMIPRFTAIGLLTPGGRCAGAFGLTQDGALTFVQAKTVVVACGGAGRVFAESSHPQGIAGDGYALLLRAGAELTNLEFIRFFPLNLRDAQFPAHRPARRFYDLDGLRATNSHGEDIFQKHLGRTLKEAMETSYTRFVTMSRIVAQEQADGPVYMDTTQVPERTWRAITASGTDDLIRKWDGSPGIWKHILSQRKLPVTPRVQAFLGGARVASDMSTGVEGLFAGGEAANLFFDLNSDPPCEIGPLACALTSGHLAGVGAARAATKVGSANLPDSYVRDCAQTFAAAAARSGDVPPRTIIRQIGSLMTGGCGPLRTQASLRAALEDLTDVESRLPRMRVGGAGGVVSALEAKSMALVARAVLQAALAREESRAEHYREDFTLRDDKRWARNIVARLDPKGAVQVEPAMPRG